MSSHEPEGDIVTGPPALHPSSLASTFIVDSPLSHDITLRPLTISHAQDLYTNVSGLFNDHLYTYLPGGPFSDLESFTKHIQWLIDEPTFYGFSIFSSDKAHLSNQDSAKEREKDNEGGTAISMICLLNIVPSNRSIEIGHVLYGPTLQRTTAATAAYYLIIKLCFEELHYQRVEWKCNDRNKPSERAASRLGFKYEGKFRKHMIVKGRRRDTSWFSVLDDEWEEYVREALELWLGEGNFDERGGQKRKLEEVRAEVEKKML